LKYDFSFFSPTLHSSPVTMQVTSITNLL